MTVKELIEQLQDYGDHLDVIIATIDGDRVLDSVATAPINIEDHEHDGMTGVKLFTQN